MKPGIQLGQVSQRTVDSSHTTGQPDEPRVKIRCPSKHFVVELLDQPASPDEIGAMRAWHVGLEACQGSDAQEDGDPMERACS